MGRKTKTRKQTHRSAKKRFRRRAGLHGDNTLKPTPTQGGNDENPEQEADFLAREAGFLLEGVRAEVLEKYKRELKKVSSSLTRESAWTFLAIHLREAQIMGIDDVLRQLVYEAAGRFGDIRMLRLRNPLRPR